MWKEARRIIEPVIAKRAAENWTQKESDPSRMYSDAIQWMHETARGRPYDPVVAQLALSVAAIHTTTDLLTQVIYDLCQHPDLIQPLRQEAIAALKDDGWKRTTLYKLKLMDSVIKESQRLKPAGMSMSLSFFGRNGCSCQ
jgi:cytochrome P450